MNRKPQRERRALMILWHFDGPQVPDEASDNRADALRKWRGQADEKDEKREQ